MNYSRQLTLSLLIPALVVLAAGLFVAAGTFWGAGYVGRYFAQTDAFAESTAELYAQGLQMGQALRNVVLEPSNAKAFDNLRAAAKAWDEAARMARQAAPSGAELAQLEQIAALRREQADLQYRVMSLAGSEPDTVKDLVVKKETPVWRKMREILMDLKKSAGHEKDEVQRLSQARLRQAGIFVLSLALACSLLCFAFLVWMRRSSARELGGEPAQARLALQRISGGDLQSVLSLASGAEESLMATIEQTRQALRDIVHSVRQCADQIEQASAEVAQGNHDLSSRTESAASSLQQTAASMESLTSAVRDNANGAAEAARRVQDAADLAQRGRAAVSNVVATMDAIDQSSRQIADIIATIDGIAFQTNILALNAAVEAARAGEQGRGFAVVASEVRTLAQRSAAAAKEIRSLIGGSVERVAAGTQLVRSTGATIGELESSVIEVRDVIELISRGASEQSRGISEVGSAVAHLDTMTQQNAALVEESAAAAESLKSQADQLVAVVGRFRV
ncbi:methyl-accepting chemotaxis protein [Paucibacter soli]|uniref:methyl-accepting chemotaxis protein n=1 Tax=Paucibacter soli TaxID=3133433 RepID=UPI003098581B